MCGSSNVVVYVPYCTPFNAHQVKGALLSQKKNYVKCSVCLEFLFVLKLDMAN